MSGRISGAHYFRSMNSSDTKRKRGDWLNQDSIESLKQASGGFTMQQSSARMDAARMSSTKQHLLMPMTQRGRCGKLGDSQQYAQIAGSGQGSNLLNPKMNLRQAISVHKVERPNANYGVEFNPANRTDSFAVTGMESGSDVPFDDEHIVGRQCL